MATPAELLDAVETAIQTRLSGGAVQSYSLPTGLNVQSMSISDLMDVRSTLQAEVASQTVHGRTTYARIVETI